MNSSFVDRVQELQTLRQIFSSDRFELVVIYGRRRVGKTALVREAVKELKYLYYLAIEENNLNRFAAICEEFDSEIKKYQRDYEILIEKLKDQIQVLIIDEFQNLIKENPKIVSLFQAIIDTKLITSKLKVVLMGSSISLMTSRVLDYQSPLYGRRTASFQIKPMKFIEIGGFFPNSSIEELVEIYGFADGIPAYLQEIQGSFWPWLYQNLMSLKSLFRDEVNFLLRYEFESPSMYRLILEAIAHGKTKLNEIKQQIAVKRTDISPYLRNLIEIGLIFRDVPVTESEQSRAGRYYIKDNFIKFWFRFIYPALSGIEAGIFQVETIQRQYPAYLGYIFEQIARQHALHHPIFPFTKIGRWWGQAGEIDLVALNNETAEILFGSCKWKENVNAEILLKELEGVASQVLWKNDQRRVTYTIYARSFYKKCEKYNEINVICVDLDDIKQDMKSAENLK